jgi:hypothetical protein
MNTSRNPVRRYRVENEPRRAAVFSRDDGSDPSRKKSERRP